MVPTVAQGVRAPNGHLPVLCDPGIPETGFIWAEGSPAYWEDDVHQLGFQLVPPSVLCPTGSVERSWDIDPLTGHPAEVANFESTLSGSLQVTDLLTGEVIAHNLPLHLTGSVQTLIFDKGPDQVLGEFYAELAWMQLQGSIPLPHGNQYISLSVGRENPERRSPGHTSVLNVGNIGSSGEDGMLVANFYDVFTHLWVWNNLDQDWAGPFPSQGPPAHLAQGWPQLPQGDEHDEGDANQGGIGQGMGQLTGPFKN